MILRNKQRDKWTVIDNEAVRDARLSWKARGMLVYFISLPDNWNVNIKHLSSVGKDGVESVSSGMRELEKHGYLIRRKVKDNKGRFGWEIEVTEKPCAPIPDATAPDAGNPDAEECPLRSTYVRTNQGSSTQQAPIPISLPFSLPTHQHGVDTTAYTEEDAMCEEYTYWEGEEEEARLQEEHEEKLEYSRGFTDGQFGEEKHYRTSSAYEEGYADGKADTAAGYRRAGLACDSDDVEEGLVGGSSKNISFSEPTPASRSAAQADPFYDGGSFMEVEEGLEEDGELSSTQGVVDTTTYGRLVVGGAATAQEAAHINRFISSNPVAKPAGDAIPLPAPEIAVGLASYEAWPDSKIFAYCTKTYKWDAAWMEALHGYYNKAKANPMRYVRDMCLRRIQLTLELELMGLKDEKPREFKLHHDVTKYDDPERLVMLEAEKKRQAEADARAEEKAKLLFGKGRRIRSGN